MSIDRLPPELHDHILDFLHDDIFSLKVCSLTCRLWVPTSYFHIFYRVSTPSPYFRAAFGRLLQRSPRIGNLVRQFSLSSVAMRVSAGFDPASALQDDRPEVSPTTFSSLTSVKQLEVLVLTVDPALQASLVQNFQTVSDLTLQYCHFPTFGAFVKLFRSIPNLETLAIRGVTWDQSDTIIPERTVQPPGLKQLSLGRELNVPAIVEWILTEGIHGPLESFSGCCSSERDATSYATLIRALGPSLRKCEFDWYSSRLNGE